MQLYQYLYCNQNFERRKKQKQNNGYSRKQARRKMNFFLISQDVYIIKLIKMKAIIGRKIVNYQIEFLLKSNQFFGEFVEQ